MIQYLLASANTQYPVFTDQIQIPMETVIDVLYPELRIMFNWNYLGSALVVMYPRNMNVAGLQVGGIDEDFLSDSTGEEEDIGV
jgi:hypothetical protein